MRTTFAYSGNMAHAQHIARALAEHGALDAYVTTFVFRPDGRLASLLRRLPARIRQSAARQLSRRTIDQVPAHLVHDYPVWEILRIGAAKSGAGPVITDMIWDHLSHRFDELVARRYVPRSEAIQAFEYTALASFRRAKEEGKATVLHLPSLDSRQFEDLQRREKSEWKELVGRHDAYFDRKFARRQARRSEEIALADVVIANSSLTARSHIAAGADPAKVFVAMLGAPPPIARIVLSQATRQGPLQVIWAGPFSLRKGAHYLVKAWERLNAGSAAQLHVYGVPLLPDRVLPRRNGDIVFHGSVPQGRLFEAYEAADVLVFPTLCDGFGMVVAEAMAHGLPVITTQQAGAADLVDANNGIVVPSADPHALADALQWCLDNRQKLREMRFPALETARARQWSDFRRDFICALDAGLRRAGHVSGFRKVARGETAFDPDGGAELAGGEDRANSIVQGLEAGTK